MKLSVRSLEALARMHAARRAEPPQSPERRAAMSASCKASPKVQANIKRATAAAARAKPSSIELTIRAVLDGVGVPYFPAYPIGPYAADIYVPSHRLVIECDGTYWHRNSAEKDKARDMYMIGLGYSVLRLPEQDIRAGAATPRVLHAIGRAA